MIASLSTQVLQVVWSERVGLSLQTTRLGLAAVIRCFSVQAPDSVQFWHQQKLGFGENVAGVT